MCDESGRGCDAVPPRDRVRWQTRGIPLGHRSKEGITRQGDGKMKFKIVPISKDYVNRLRASGRDDFGNKITEQVAGGFGPCRLSLKPFRPSIDRRILLGHSPFKMANAFNQPVPIFVNSADVDEYSDVNRFPPEIKADKQNFPLSLIGYNASQQMVFSELVGDQDVDEMIERIFEEESDVEYLHARNSEACCFICKIERV